MVLKQKLYVDFLQYLHNFCVQTSHHRSRIRKILALYPTCSLAERLLLEGGYYWRAATIGGWLLLEGGYYWRVATIGGRLLLEGGYNWRVATIGGWLLLEGGYYWRVATIGGWLLFEGGYYSRVATIRGWLLYEGGYYSRVATIRGWLLFEGGYIARCCQWYTEPLSPGVNCGTTRTIRIVPVGNRRQKYSHTCACAMSTSRGYYLRVVFISLKASERAVTI